MFIHTDIRAKLPVLLIYFFVNSGCVTSCPERCECNDTIVDCSGLGMNKIPNDIPLNCTSLILSSNLITKIMQNDLNGLTDLETLFLDTNKIKEVENGAFTSLSSLKTLDLSNNELSRLDDTVFVNLTELTNINLMANSMNTLSPAIFSDIMDLNTFSIDLSKNPWSCGCWMKMYKQWLETVSLPVRLMFDIICHAPANHAGKALTNITIDLSCPRPQPTFSDLFPLVNVNKGSSTSLHCDTEGVMIDTISWVLPDKSVVTPDNIGESGAVSFENNGKILNIEAATRNMDGTYICVMHSGATKQISVIGVSVNGTTDEEARDTKVIIKEVCRSHKTSSYVGVFLGGFILAVAIAGCAYPVYRYCRSHIRKSVINRDHSVSYHPKVPTYYENNGIHLQDFHSDERHNAVNLQDFQSGEQKI